MPKATIEIHMNKRGKESIVFNTTANDKGEWEAIYENIIPSGAYEVWVKQILDTGAESLSSQSVYIGVNSWLWRAWQWLQNIGIVLIVLINLLFLIVILAAVAYYLWHHFKLWRIKLRREIHVAESAVASGFKKLKKEIKSGKVASKVLKDLSEIEKNIEKEIEDIEKK